MGGMGNFIGRHFVAPFSALSEALPLAAVLIVILLMYPFAIQTMFHPEDAVGFQQWIQGLPVSHYITSQAKAWGFMTAMFALAFLLAVHFIVLLLIYRQTQKAFSSWVVALLIVGGLANGVWWLRTGYFDAWGAMAGLSPILLVIAIEAVMEKLGKDFIFGKGNRPDYAY
jgi:hypothetical protein